MSEPSNGVAARAELERKLKSTETRWRSIVESAVDAIIVIDAKARIEFFNTAAVRLFGYSEAEVLGRNVNMLMPAPYHDEHDGYLSRYVATRDPHIIGIGRQVTAIRKDGTTFPVHLSVGEMVIDGETKFTGILHDLSARMQLEVQLREQASMARIGEMAAVIAHEVKNPLAGIRGAIQVIGRRQPADGKDFEITKEIVSRIDALNDLIKDLLLFARPPQPKPTRVDVLSLLTATADLLKADPLWKDLRVEIAGSESLVTADAELLKIVFVNLFVNGAQAMQGRGTIRASVESTPRWCRVVITDTGSGIPADVRDRIFTPFFTTKARGTGLGLPTAKRLVEAHQGRIAVGCPPEGGTAVTVEIPLAGA